VDDTPGPTLEGVGLALAYYAGTTKLAGAPSAPGTYTAVASFPGSTDYKPASASVIFTLNPSTQGAPTAAIADGDFGGDASGVRGQSRSFLLSATDSSGTALASATFTVDWGDGHTESFTNLTVTTPVSHTWAKAGNYTIAVTAIVNGVSSPVVTKPIAVKVVDYQLVQTDSVTGATAWALVVGGSTHSNVIEFESDACHHQIVVEIENRCTGHDEFHQAFADSVNGAPVGRLIAYGQASDLITVACDLRIDAELHASDAGNSILKGGGGDDLLVGGSGDDILVGGSGRDLLIGGTGNDLILGGSGQDIIIAGKTVYDHNDLALRSLLSEWVSADSFAVRMSDIQGQTQTGADRNGGYCLNTTTVLDDQSVDVLVGGSGRDWFFADTNGHTGPRDLVLGLHAGDVVINI
jgi:Ca2+-binding RTX toxin-like protein